MDPIDVWCKVWRRGDVHEGSRGPAILQLSYFRYLLTAHNGELFFASGRRSGGGKDVSYVIKTLICSFIVCLDGSLMF